MSQSNSSLEVPGSEESASPYQMTLSLNVLNHLGLNLYSNVPAVLSEAVSNAWDADAEHVEVDINPDDGEIVIVDDGHGMDEHDVNHRYLHVGYRRRQDEDRPNRTPVHGRPVMGRKGIGKLSLLSIAGTVEVYTTKGDDRHGFRMNVDDIKQAIGEEADGGNAAVARNYTPEPIDEFPDDLEQGTKIVLSDLKKRIHTAEGALRRRLARRFSVLGDEYDFTVRINGEEVTATDRDYFHKVQFLWTFDGDEYVDYCRDSKVESHETRPHTTDDGFDVRGWIGTVEKPSDLVEDYPGQDTEADDLNKVSLMVRGKMAKPDLLEDFNDGRMYTKYLVGEIHADFLDYDNESDIATSNREDIVKEDPRYQDLLTFLKDELNHIAGRWNDLRNQRGAREARRIGPIDMWFESLSPGNRDRAEKLFGKINQISVEDESERQELFKHGVLAFENMKYQENLQQLNEIGWDDTREVDHILTDLDDIESSKYQQIAEQRLRVVEGVLERIDENGLDDATHELLVEHPWLLDPSWERAADDRGLDEATWECLERANDRFVEEEVNLGAELRVIRTMKGYTMVSLRHPSEEPRPQLLEDVDTYSLALESVLEDQGVDPDRMCPEVVFVIASEGSEGWNDIEGMMKRRGAEIRRYEQLLTDTAETYRSYLANEENAGRVSRLFEDIESGNAFE